LGFLRAGYRREGKGGELQGGKYLGELTGTSLMGRPETQKQSLILKWRREVSETGEGGGEWQRNKQMTFRGSGRGRGMG